MSASKKSPDSLTEFWKKNLGIKNKETSVSKDLSKKHSEFNLKIGEYVRVSPTDDLPEEGSLVNHPQRYREYIAQKNQFKPGWGKIVKTYVDKLKSAKDMNRPAFIQMCQAIQNEEINAIICTELSRISRSVKDFVQFWEFLKKHNVQLILVNSFIDTSDFMGEYWLYQEINNAEMERKRTIHRIRSGHFSRANRGLTSGGVRVLGYDPDPHRKCHLIVNKKEVPLVNMIFNKFLELGSIAKTVQYLNENGYKTKSYITRTARNLGGKNWSNQTLHTLLTNLIYLGLREINKRKRKLDQEKLPENEKYSVVDGQWPAIIKESVFIETQKIIQKNKRLTRSSVHNYLLTGVLICDECGSQLVGRSGNGKGGRYFYYTHPMSSEKNQKKKRCRLYTVPAPKLEEKILERIGILANDKKLLKKIVSKSNQKDSKSVSSLNSLIKSRHNQIRESKADIDNLLNVLAKNKNYDSTLLKKIDTLTKNIETIELEAKSLEEKRHRLQNTTIDLGEISQFFTQFKQNLNNLNNHLQKEAVRSVIKKIVLSESLVTVELFCGYQKLLNNPNLLDKNKNVNHTKYMFELITQSESSFDFESEKSSLSILPTPPILTP